MIDTVGKDHDPLAPALWFLVAEAGHAGCHGWMFDRRDRRLRCACGTALYEFQDRTGNAPARSVPGRGGAEGNPP